MSDEYGCAALVIVRSERDSCRPGAVIDTNSRDRLWGLPKLQSIGFELLHLVSQPDQAVEKLTRISLVSASYRPTRYVDVILEKGVFRLVEIDERSNRRHQGGVPKGHNVEPQLLRVRESLARAPGRDVVLFPGPRHMLGVISVDRCQSKLLTEPKYSAVSSG